jgi:energy-coupling factor transporter ATP-binding protein EcfA2
MAIPLKQPPEPNSRFFLRPDRSGPAGNELLFMESEAARQLAREIRGYCEGRNIGRSFLIAGHRGAGKTTLVNVALHLAQRDSEGDAATTCIPVLVPLQGPTLLDSVSSLQAPENRGGRKDSPPQGAETDEGDDDQASEAEDSEASDSSDNAAEDPPAADPVLSEITLALHRAAVDQLIQSLRASIHEAFAALLDQVERSREKSRDKQESLLRRRLEMDSLAAGLELELDEFPDPARLVEFWRRLGRLDTGILRWSRVGTSVGDRFEQSDHGLREIVALASLNEARRRVSGSLKSELQGSESGKREAEISISGQTGEITKVIVSLLGGTAATAAARVAGGTSPTGSLLAGLLTALGTLFILKYSASWTRKRTVDRKELFVPDRSSATLERVLPVLIERLRAAGMAPIFVVDELDKVRDLDVRLARVIPRLKKLVAERAFFCFIVDRSYFEGFTSLSAEHNYVKEYTFFTNYLFVTYSPSDFHDYLRRLMDLPEPGKVASTPPVSGVDSLNQGTGNPKTEPAPTSASPALTKVPP